MKYELNKPYNFEVKRVVDESGTLTFQVEIEGNLFPVKAYPEQLEESTPSIVSCRILLDKNNNAYLVQNETFLYPYLYKPSRRYIFEVVYLDESYIVLHDKHNLFHTIPKDDLQYALNEIIVRYVSIINDNNGKAHLVFHTSCPIIQQKDDLESNAALEKPNDQEASNTIPPTSQPSNNQNCSNLENKDLSSESTIKEAKASSESKIESVSSMILSKNWDNLRNYLSNNFRGSNIDPIKEEIIVSIQKSPSPQSYWESIHFFLGLDPQMYISTLGRIDKSQIIGIDSGYVPTFLDDIIHTAFSSSKKQHAIELLKPCKDHFTIEQKNYIQTACSNLKTHEAFYKLFKLLRFTPLDAVLYLLSLKNNDAAAYTLYVFYYNANNNNSINENSAYIPFRPKKILEFCRIMENMKAISFKSAAQLIKHNVLKSGSCPFDLKNQEAKNGFQGFLSYIEQKKHQEKRNNLLDSLSKGDTLTNLSYIKEIDNYYLLIDQKTGIYALLDKDLTSQKPREKVGCTAKIISILDNKGKEVILVAQKPIPTIYTFPPLVNNSTILEIAFSQGRNSLWYPEVKKYCKLLNVEVVSRPRIIDFKVRHKAEIVQRKDFFTYSIKILE